MDLYKLLIYTTLLLTIYLSRVDSGKYKYGGHVKPLFGIGLGYKKVVSYKPVIVFQKHKHMKIKHHGGWGWGGGGGGWGGGWGWKPKGHGHKGGGGGYGGGGGGWGHKNIDHHHYHHNDGWGGGGGGGDDGWGWGEDQDDYGGWESQLKPAAAATETKIPDQISGHQQTHPQPQPAEMLQVKGQILSDYEIHENHRQEDEKPQAQPVKHDQQENHHGQFRSYRNYAHFNMGHQNHQQNPMLPLLLQSPSNHYPPYAQQFPQIQHQVRIRARKRQG